MGRDTHVSSLNFPPCNMAGNICFEGSGTPDEIRRRAEASMGLTFEDDATETGEFSYRASTFGFVIRLRVDASRSPSVLCRFSASTDTNLGLLDIEAADIPLERHLASLVEVNGLGRLISLDEVKKTRASNARTES